MHSNRNCKSIFILESYDWAFRHAQLVALSEERILTINFHIFAFSRHRDGCREIDLWILVRKYGCGPLQQRVRWSSRGYSLIPLGLLRMYVSVVFVLGVCNVPKTT